MIDIEGKLVITTILNSYMKFVKLPAWSFGDGNHFFLLNIPFLWST